jgi:hypothetical protein
MTNYANTYPTQLLSQKDIALEYGIKKTQFYELIKAGDIPCIVWGKRGKRVQRADVDAAIARNKELHGK